MSHSHGPHDPGCSDSCCGCGHSHASGEDHGPRPPVAEPPAPWRPNPQIRPVTLAVFEREGQILAGPVHDDAGQILGWRPLGGDIQPGERAAEALSRALSTSTGQTVSDLAPLGVLEHIFTHEGAPGHEIVFAFRARFDAPEIYQADALAFTDQGRPAEAKWIALAKARAGRIRLIPEGLLDLL